MDAPPRMSLAAANALKASDFVLIPAKLQFLAISPIRKMMDYLKTFKKTIRARFRILGVVCNMTGGGRPVGNEEGFLNDVKTILSGHADDPIIFDTLIPDRKDIGRPEGAALGYMLSSRDANWVRETFDALAEQILGRIDTLNTSPNRS
jgi:cellulose biosynthesis protein BcsQ